MTEKITKQQIEEAKKKLKEKKQEKTKQTETSSEKPKTDTNKEITEPRKETPKKEKKERIGILNIYTTFNNTIMNLTDLAGDSIAKFSGGQSTKQNRLKANPTIAMFIAQKISEEAKDNGITGFYVKIRAETGQNNPGPGAHAAIKSLTRAGFKILSIMETTKNPRGGPKKKGGRRGRRV
jgi:small subunit ribosomal protein S11